MLVLVRTGTPDMVGQYGIAMALVAPVMALANLQLRGLQATDASESFAFGDYLALRLISILVALVWLVALIGLSTDSMTVRAVAVFVALKLVLNSVSDVYYGLFQQMERLDVVAQATMWTNVANFILFSVAMWITGNLVLATGMSAVSSVAPLLLHNIPTARDLLSGDRNPRALLPIWRASQLRLLFFQALPLAIVSLMISLNTNVPRYFLMDYGGAAAVGVFVALASLLVASNTLTTAIAQTVSPRLARYFAKGDRGRFIGLLGQLVLASLGVGTLGVAMAYLAGPAVISWLYDPTYGQDRGAIVWLAVAASIGILGRFVANAITVGRRLYVQVAVNVASLGALGLTCLLLVPSRGVEGAAVALSAAGLVRLLFNALVLVALLKAWLPGQHLPAKQS